MFWIFLVILLISSVNSSGEFSVLQHPPGLYFRNHDHLKQSDLVEVYTAALGFSIQHYSNWRGMYINSPFDVAEAIVTVSVDGVSDIGQQKGHHFPLKTDSSELHVYHKLADRITMHFPDQDTNLVRIELSNGLDDTRKFAIFEDIHNENPKRVSPKTLSFTVDEDRQFLKEITLLHEIADKVEQGVVKHDNIPDIFWFQVSGLHALSDVHGENSTETMEAKLLLNDAILHINTAFKKAYKDSALITVITSDASHTRRSRSILQTEDKEKTPADDYNLASYYDKDYPVIFNIILWFGVMMVFSLIAICLAIGNMDPGRDSIIYRMTSTRMKKEN